MNHNSTKRFFVISFYLCACIYSSAPFNGSEIDSRAYTVGKALYTKGVLPNGERVSATVQGDIAVEGDQLICETCHRRSGMGSTEGQQVVPAVAGNLLFNPLQLPLSKPPEPPVFRPGYTRETLMAAIRDGIDANGEPLDPFMPRYDIDDEALNGLMTYVDTLSKTPSPGVTEDTIHFATVILSSNSEADNKALVDVMEQYVKQKNVETRYESKRAKNAPWHKEWLFKPYRKWQIHTWELKGKPQTWPAQLDAYYTKQPVFAIINGLVPSGWEEVNSFCENQGVPCLFPTTRLPVIEENNFYTIYMTKGAVHEAEAAASYIVKNPTPGRVIQFVDRSDQRSAAAAESLRAELEKSGIKVLDVEFDNAAIKTRLPSAATAEETAVLWLDKPATDRLLGSDLLLNSSRILLSTRFYGTDVQQIPVAMESAVLFVHSSAMPDRVDRLLLRSTGWFKAKRIYNPAAKEIQANAYFALKVVGDAIKHIRGYFYRDYFIEKIEHMIDDLPYTSIYPRVSMAPDQRFVSRGFYIAKVDAKGGLRNITDWIAP
jgi:hypothetical protein